MVFIFTIIKKLINWFKLEKFAFWEQVIIILSSNSLHYRRHVFKFWKKSTSKLYNYFPPNVLLNEGKGSLKFILNNYWLTAVATTDELPPAMFFDVDSDQFIV